MKKKKLKEIYFDNNATTKTLTKVQKAMIEVLGEGFGNPSSSHATGERVRRRISEAREFVGRLIGADSSRIIFTSGGTESNNMVLFSFFHLYKNLKKCHIITTKVEHSSIKRYCEFLITQGVEIDFLPVDPSGRISLSDLDAAIKPNTVLVSIQWANSETGVIQPIEDISRICKKYGILFHTDGAQAVGKIDINVSSLPIDFLSFTAHKFHGPQGIGALYVKNFKSIFPMFLGGLQENGLRAGTENVPGIVGFGKAAEIRNQKLISIQKKLSNLRDYFETLVLKLIPETEINGNKEYRICNTTNILFRGIDGQALIGQLDKVNIRCSQGSACMNMSPEPSYVLLAMGLSEEEAYSSLRFSFSELNTFEEVEIVGEKLSKICKKLRNFKLNINT